MEIIGYISQDVIKTLNLKISPNTPVFIGESNLTMGDGRLFRPQVSLNIA